MKKNSKGLIWLIKELIKVYSVQDSFFSKKRIESGIAFFMAQSGMIYFLITKISTMNTTDIVLWAATEFAVAGYIISQIQKEKLTTTTPNENNL